jgi:small GTP-binding protein
MSRKKKVCMLGASAVGKTSLVRRFVQGIFKERYLSTVGVKIDRKDLRVDGHDMTMMLWDLHGEDDVTEVRASYLRASGGCLLVADGTRGYTLKRLRTLRERVVSAAGEIPLVLVLNKCDLADVWDIEEGTDALEGLDDLPMIRTSALDGTGVEQAFQLLGRSILQADGVLPRE